MKKTKYVYILSQRYSGSTLLSFLLATHPEVSTIGERRKFYNKSIKSKSFNHHRAKHCSCGETFEDCSFFNELKKRLLQRVNPNSLNSNATEFNLFANRHVNHLVDKLVEWNAMNKSPFGLFPFDKKIKQVCQFNKILVEELLDLEGTTIFLDSSKSIKHILYLSMIPTFDLSIIWLTRDPRGQVNSAMKYNAGWDTETATQYWKQEMENNHQVFKRTGLKYLPLQYESLCKNPLAALKTISQFTGLDANNFSLNFRKKQQHIIGNGKMRLGKEKKITERTEWKQELTKDQIQTIEKLTSDYQQFYSN